MARFRRRHQIVGIVCGDPLQQFTAFRVARDDHAALTFETQEAGAKIEP